MIKLVLLFILAFPIFALEKINLQLQWYDQFQFAGYYIAKEKGFYKEEGLDVHIKKFTPSTNVVEEVISDQSQYGIGRSSLILDKANGADIISLAAIFQSSPMVLLSLKDKNIKQIQDYKKVTFMAGDIINSAEFKIMILNEAIKIDDLTIIDNSGNVDDLINKKADFMLAYISNEPFILEEKGLKYNVLSPKDQGVSFYSDILFTSQNEIKNHPQRVEKFLKASLKGWQYAFDNIQESVNLIYHKYNTQNKTKKALHFEAKQLKKLALYNTQELGEIDLHKLQRIYNIYKVLGQLKSDFDLSSMLYKKHKLHLSQEEMKFLSGIKKLRVSNEMNWPPYNYNEYGIAKGYSIDYMNLLAQKLGIEIEYVSNYTWNEFLEQIRAKKIDIMLNIVQTEKRSKYIHFTKEYARTSPSIFTRGENYTIKSIDDLNGKILSIPKGFYYEEVIKKYYPNIQLKYVHNTLEAIRDVQFKRADATLSNFSVARYLIKYYGINNLKAVTNIPDERFLSKLNIGVRDDMPHLVSILNKTMQYLDDKTILELRQKWLDTTTLPEKKSIQFTQAETKYIESIKDIKICVDPGWEPYEYIKNNEYQGLTADYIDYISNIINKPFTLIPTTSFKQSLEYAKFRKCDILPSAAITIDRLNYLNFTEPYIKIPMVIATNSKKRYITDIDNYRDKTFGIIQGYATAEILRKKHPDIKIKEFPSIKEALMAVQNESIHGFIDTALTIGSAFRTYKMHDLKIAGELQESYDLGMAIRNDRPILLSIFQKSLSSMNQEEKNNINKKWLSIKYEKVIDYTLVFSILVPVIFFFIIIIFYLWNIKLKKEIKEKVRLEQKLKTSIADFKMLVNSTLEAIFILSHTGHITQANDEAKKLFKLTKPADFIGKHILYFIASIDKENVINKIRLDKSLPHEVNFLKNDGTTFPGLVKGENLITPKQTIRVVSIVDLTDLKQKEHLLYQQSKMAMMGEMMSAIAHQWRQPLNALAALNMQVEMKLEIDEKITEKEYEPISDDINKQLSYMSKTIDDFRDFFIPSKEKTLFNVCQIVNEVYDILKPQFTNNNIVTKIKCTDTYVLGFPNEFKQVIINILNNAKDAIISNNINQGEIIVKIAKINGKVKILIKDNGGGIKPEILSKIFNPYFTTKFESKGTGIGLYMSKMIIEQSMKGVLKVKSYKNNTVFMIIL